MYYSNLQVNYMVTALLLISVKSDIGKIQRNGRIWPSFIAAQLRHLWTLSPTPWHLHYEHGSRLELWGERSGDITPPGRFKCSVRGALVRAETLHYTCCSISGKSYLFSMCVALTRDTTLHANSKHWFTTSFLPWRKMLESDARSVHYMLCSLRWPLGRAKLAPALHSANSHSV